MRFKAASHPMAPRKIAHRPVQPCWPAPSSAYWRAIAPGNAKHRLLLAQNVMKLVGFLRLMQHPDGAMAHFHGGGLVSRDLVAQLTRYGNHISNRKEIRASRRV